MKIYRHKMPTATGTGSSPRKKKGRAHATCLQFCHRLTNQKRLRIQFLTIGAHLRATKNVMKTRKWLRKQKGGFVNVLIARVRRIQNLFSRRNNNALVTHALKDVQVSHQVISCKRREKKRKTRRRDFSRHDGEKEAQGRYYHTGL